MKNLKTSNEGGGAINATGVILYDGYQRKRNLYQQLQTQFYQYVAAWVKTTDSLLMSVNYDYFKKFIKMA